MFEVAGLGILIAGSLLVITGLFWLIGLAWRRRLSVGLLTILTLPLGGPLVYGLTRFAESKRPLILVISGLLLGATPFGWNLVQEKLFGLGERERIINGERHLTLTGWDRPDYRILKEKSDTVVLEMGNPDVTDATLESLASFNRLKELTLNDSGISDAGLKTLTRLPALQSLRVARTKITKDGVIAFLESAPQSLKEVDVSGNSIPASILRKWKNQDPDHRRYVN